VDRVVAVTALSFLFQAGILMLLLLTELGDTPHEASRGTFLELAFETTSAFGTVGLSTGGTSQLTPIGRALVIILMFVGRIGPLTVSSLLAGRRRSALRYPEEDVLVG
jgi:trk system potassium uptake protein TrkH